jgi:hypothetical protein
MLVWAADVAGDAGDAGDRLVGQIKKLAISYWRARPGLSNQLSNVVRRPPSRSKDSATSFVADTLPSTESSWAGGYRPRPTSFSPFSCHCP